MAQGRCKEETEVMVHTIKQSKPYDEQTYEERAADMMRFIDEMKALYAPRSDC